MRGSENGQTDILRRIGNVESTLVERLDSVLKQREEVKQELDMEPSHNTDSTQAPVGQVGADSQLETLDDAAVCLGVVAKQLAKERSQLTIGEVTGEEEARVVVGRPETTDVDARIGDVKAGKKATVVVGVYSQNLNMADIFKSN